MLETRKYLLTLAISLERMAFISGQEIDVSGIQALAFDDTATFEDVKMAIQRAILR